MLQAWSRARGVVTALPRVNKLGRKVFCRYLCILAEPFDRSSDTPGSEGILEFDRYRLDMISNSLHGAAS